MQNEYSENVLQWLEEIDQKGPFMPLDELEAFISTAPAAARKTTDYHHIRGLHIGRAIHEIAAVVMPLEMLEAVVFDMQDKHRETTVYQYMLGVYDGRLMYEFGKKEGATVTAAKQDHGSLNVDSHSERQTVKQ